ncbi:hypothetical protein [Paractinoplanes maris]|uniref:hypothetical protein n=1 Tax=Paractinoplanes maris TaxID=1734446 RepID=UPI0020228EC1|nr:hypothetical protein [Actinoplanes maris]
MPSNRIATKRYGGPAEIAGFAGVFGVLVIIAAGVLFSSAHLLSDGCVAGSGQVLCPIDGPDWSRPLPAAAILLGLVAGLVGVAAGRPIRKPALVAGYVLVAVGLALSLLIG